MEPSSPASADRFFTAEPPGKPKEKGGRTLTLTQPAQDSQHILVPHSDVIASVSKLPSLSLVSFGIPSFNTPETLPLLIPAFQGSERNETCIQSSCLAAQAPPPVAPGAKAAPPAGGHSSQ